MPNTETNSENLDNKSEKVDKELKRLYRKIGETAYGTSEMDSKFVESLISRRDNLLKRRQEINEQLAKMDNISSDENKPDEDTVPDNTEVDETTAPAEEEPIDGEETPETDTTTNIETETTDQDKPTDSEPESPAESEDTPDESPDESETSTETTINKPKNNAARAVITAAAILSAAAIIATLFSGGSKKSKKESTPQLTSSSVSESYESVRGIQDGYDKPGMYLSEAKSSPYNFADASVVAEQCDLDEVEMVKYTAENQVESFADYLANLPAPLQPQGFRGLSIVETERRLESLSDKEFDSLKQYFDKTMDDAFTRRVNANGDYDNAYMRPIDSSKPITHDNMELVRFSTNENSEYTEFYWIDQDGNRIGSMLVKMSPVYDQEKNIVSYSGCLQVINPKGSAPNLYKGIPEIPTPEPTPAPAPETTPEQEPEPEPEQGDLSGGKLPDSTPEQEQESEPEQGEFSGGKLPESTPPPAPTYTPSYRPSYTPPDTPKDSDNLVRIDNNIKEDIAEDIHTEEVKITPTADVTGVEEVTVKPAPEEYHEPEPTIVQNEPSRSAEQIVTPSYTPGSTTRETSTPSAEATTNTISPENNYTIDLGGANESNAEARPVEANPAAQAAANAAEIPVSEAPTSGAGLGNILSGLG